MALCGVALFGVVLALPSKNLQGLLVSLRSQLLAPCRGPAQWRGLVGHACQQRGSEPCLRSCLMNKQASADRDRWIEPQPGSGWIWRLNTASKCALSRSVGIPRLRVSGIQNGTEPPRLLFSLYHLVSCVRFTPESKVQSSEVDEVFFRRCTSGFAWSSDDLPHFLPAGLSVSARASLVPARLASSAYPRRTIRTPTTQ